MADIMTNGNQVIGMIDDESKSHQRQIVKSFVEIIKPRISTMVLLTVWAGSVASGWAFGNLAWLHAMVGTLLVAASGSAMNQYLERYSDFFMPRTSKRPLPAGRLTATEVAVFAAVTLGIGMAYLFATVHWVSAMWCLSTWVMYVFVYTLSKPLTAWNTAVGAFPGAMPVLVGASAAEGTIGPLSWILFSILLLWQFPHFMAIAWKYRADYAEGGLKMVTVTDPTGRQAGWIAVGVSAALLLVALSAVFWLTYVAIYVVISIVLGSVYFWRSLQFLQDRNDQTARSLLLFSLLHLPVQMIALIFCM